MNKPNIVIICVSSMEKAQIVANNLVSGVISVEDLTNFVKKTKSNLKPVEQLTTEIVEAALSQFIEKINNAEKKKGRTSLFRRCEDYLQQDKRFALQLRQMFTKCEESGLDISDLLDEYELSFLTRLV